MNVNIETGLWTCHGCKAGGSVIDLIAKYEGVNPKVVLKRLGETPEGYKPAPSLTVAQPQAGKPPEAPASGKDAPAATQPPRVVARYDYRNALGTLVYQAVRLEPKSFRQRRPHPDFDSSNPVSKSNPAWVYNMDGVERVLYQLPKILTTQDMVVICEGEKDCDNVTALGWIATTNVGGAGKWLDAYTETLSGKDIVLCGDNDKPGKEHMEKVFESLAGKVKSVRVVTIPKPFKDVSDWFAGGTFIGKDNQPDEHIKAAAFQALIDASPVFEKGINLPVKSMSELEVEFKQSIAKAATRSLDFTSWLPSLGQAVRPMVPGEMVTIIAATKVGKSCLAANLVYRASPLKTIYFQQELPGSLSFERFVAMGTNTPAREVYHKYKSGLGVDWRGGGLEHVFFDHRTRLSMEEIEATILKSELKIGEPPALAVVDYVQLCGGNGERYARVSDAAEGFKQVCKRTNVVGIMLSQRGRAGVQGVDDSNVEVRLTDGKESGGIENSSGLVLGAWRDAEDLSLLNIRILANTKGFPGKLIKCNFDGERMVINERAENSVDPADVPTETHHAND
jgi:5S rRNA maturation endonuclease (ribonuclease M5)